MSNAPAPPGLSELLAGCLRGNRRSQEILYRQFYGYAMSICLRYTPSRDEALEVLNDGFLKVFTRLDQFDTRQPFKPWLRRIMINTALDQYRQAVQHYRQEDLSLAEQTPEPGADAFSRLVHEELVELIQLLSPAYRLVFNLFVMDGFSHEEIATQLGISVGASKSNLARARENLKAMLIKKSQTGLGQDKYARVIR